MLPCTLNNYVGGGGRGGEQVLWNFRCRVAFIIEFFPLRFWLEKFRLFGTMEWKQAVSWLREDISSSLLYLAFDLRNSPSSRQQELHLVFKLFTSLPVSLTEYLTSSIEAAVTINIIFILEMSGLRFRDWLAPGYPVWKWQKRLFTNNRLFDAKPWARSRACSSVFHLSAQFLWHVLMCSAQTEIPD